MPAARLVCCAVLAAGLTLVPVACPAEHWARHTDRRQNPLILEAMQSGDLAEALQAARALSRREDPYVSDILAGLLGGGQELLVQFLLDAVFSPSEPDETLRRKLSANSAGVEALAAGLTGYGLSLRREVVRLLRHAGTGVYDGQVLAQAAWLEKRIRAQGGKPGAEAGELALEVLRYAGASGNPVFLDAALRLQECSRERRIARLAAGVAAELAYSKKAFGNPAEW